jgi:hypothetical protein
VIASTHQVLKVWTQLEDAYNGRHNYGGTVAEIYVYLLLPHSPSLVAKPWEPNSYSSRTAWDSDRELYVGVTKDFIEIFKLFEKTRNCSIEIEYRDDAWASVDDFFSGIVPLHRLHVKVTPNG